MATANVALVSVSLLRRQRLGALQDTLPIHLPSAFWSTLMGVLLVVLTTKATVAVNDVSSTHLELMFISYNSEANHTFNMEPCEPNADLLQQCSPTFKVILQDTDKKLYATIVFGPYFKKNFVHFSTWIRGPVDFFLNPVIVDFSKPPSNLVLWLKVYNKIIKEDNLIGECDYNVSKAIEFLAPNQALAPFTKITARSKCEEQFRMLMMAKLYCAPGFYGINCSKHCEVTDSSDHGHYTCSVDGNKICNPGWQNPSNDCKDPVSSVTTIRPPPVSNETKVVVEIGFINYTYLGTENRLFNGIQCNKDNKPCSPMFNVYFIGITHTEKNISFGPYAETNKIIFEKSLPAENKSKIDNPITFQLNNYEKTKYAIIKVFNNVTQGKMLIGVNSIDKINIPKLNVIDSNSVYAITMSRNTVKMYLSLRYFCELHYYSTNCNIYCLDSDSDSGHYTCGEHGEPICLPGWTDPATKCLTPVSDSTSSVTTSSLPDPTPASQELRFEVELRLDYYSMNTNKLASGYRCPEIKNFRAHCFPLISIAMLLANKQTLVKEYVLGAFNNPHGMEFNDTVLTPNGKRIFNSMRFFVKTLDLGNKFKFQMFDHVYKETRKIGEVIVNSSKIYNFNNIKQEFKYQLIGLQNNNVWLMIGSRTFCRANYYGSQCNKHCQSYNDNENGHYTCSDEGDKVCLPGWSAPQLDCKKAVPLPPSTTTKTPFYLGGFKIQLGLVEFNAKVESDISPIFQLCMQTTNPLCYIIGPYMNQSNIRFEEYLKRYSDHNPLIFAVLEYEPKSVLEIIIGNQDLKKENQMVNKTVELSQIAKKSLSGGVPITVTTNLPMLSGAMNLKITMTVTCNDNYYGDKCIKHCIDWNNYQYGHYKCDSNGNKICLPGWKFPKTDCITPDNSSLTTLSSTLGTSTTSTLDITTTFIPSIVTTTLTTTTTAATTTTTTSTSTRSPITSTTTKSKLTTTTSIVDNLTTTSTLVNTTTTSTGSVIPLPYWDDICPNAKISCFLINGELNRIYLERLSRNVFRVISNYLLQRNDVNIFDLVLLYSPPLITNATSSLSAVSMMTLLNKRKLSIDLTPVTAHTKIGRLPVTVLSVKVNVDDKILDKRVVYATILENNRLETQILDPVGLEQFRGLPTEIIIINVDNVLSGGAIAGVILVIILLIGIVLAGVFIYVKRRQFQEHPHYLLKSETKPESSNVKV